MRKLTKLIDRLTDTGAGPHSDSSSETEMTDSKSDDFTLKDSEIIGFIETLDKRLSSLEHDLWIVRRRIAERADSESQN